MFVVCLDVGYLCPDNGLRPRRYPALHNGRFVAALFSVLSSCLLVDALEPIMQTLQIREAHAAVHLGCQPGHLAANVVQMRLGLQCREAGLFGQRVLGVGGKPDERAARLKHGGEIGERVLDALE